jgi:hypothetical protein
LLVCPTFLFLSGLQQDALAVVFLPSMAALSTLFWSF